MNIGMMIMSDCIEVHLKRLKKTLEEINKPNVINETTSDVADRMLNTFAKHSPIMNEEYKLANLNLSKNRRDLLDETPMVKK